MFKHIRLRQEALTPALAEEFATMPAHKGERPLRPDHVAWLSGKIETGLFHPPRWAEAWLNGKKYRVNGQHSSTALSQANGHFPKGMQVLIDEYACNTDDDVADLFAQFDPKMSMRTDAEIVMATARQHGALDDIKPTPIRIAVGAVINYLNFMGKVGGKASAEAQRAMIPDNIEFIRWATQFLGTGRLRITGAAAALYATWLKSPDAAAEFWNAVRNESHPDHEHATRKLGRFLSLLKAGHEFNKKKGKPWTPRAVFVKCIHAWNAHRKGEGTELAYFEDSPIPPLR